MLRCMAIWAKNRKILFIIIFPVVILMMYNKNIWYLAETAHFAPAEASPPFYPSPIGVNTGLLCACNRSSALPTANGILGVFRWGPKEYRSTDGAFEFYGSSSFHSFVITTARTIFGCFLSEKNYGELLSAYCTTFCDLTVFLKNPLAFSRTIFECLHSIVRNLYRLSAYNTCLNSGREAFYAFT